MSRTESRSPMRPVRPSTASAIRKPIPNRTTIEDSNFLLESSRINSQFSNRNSFFSNSSRASLSTVPTAVKTLGYADKLDKPFQQEYFTQRQFYIPSDEEQKENPQLTLELLRTMTPKNTVSFLDKNPIFLKAMVASGYLSTDIISSVSLTFTPNELQKFMLNMANETNIYASLCSSISFTDVEMKLVQLLPITKVFYWASTPARDYLVSETLDFVMSVKETVLGRCLRDNSDDVFIDVRKDPDFNFDNDRKATNGMRTMQMLAVHNKNGEPVGVLQIIGFKRKMSTAEAEPSKYYTKTLKIARQIIERKLADQSSTGMPTSVSQVFRGIDRASIGYTAQQVGNFLKYTFKCAECDLFEFDEKSMTLTRLTDRAKFSEKEGGLSFQAGVRKSFVIMPRGCESAFPMYRHDIDGLVSSNSTLAQSIYTMQHHYVVALRGRSGSPSFGASDVALLGELGPLLCDALRTAAWVEGMQNAKNETEGTSKLYEVECDALSRIAGDGARPKDVVIESCRRIFGTPVFLIASFDGRNMVFQPGGITVKFEECAAGLAYNYRDTKRTRRGETGFCSEIYDAIGAAAEYVISFPYRVKGRVAGAIEIVNPTSEPPDEAFSVFGDICGCILGA